MTRKLKVLTLILVTLSIVFGTQVAASLPIARPDVMYPEKSFTLDNPEALKQVRVLVKVVTDAAAVVTGPYYGYYVNEDGSLEVRYADYNLTTSDGKKYLITLGMSYGSVVGSMAYNAENSSDYCEENHFIIGNRDLTYLVSDSSVKLLNEHSSEDGLATLTAKAIAVKNAIKNSSHYLLTLGRKIFSTTEFNFNSISSINSNIVGSELPIVGMTGSDGIGNCYSACIASIVRYREPLLYGNLTAKKVQIVGDDMYKRVFDYPAKVTIEIICDVMMTEYLDDTDTPHYSMAFGIYDTAMSQSSYKSIIDNGCVMLGVFRPGSLSDSDNAGLMHSIALSQYSINEDVVTAIGIDPMGTGEILAINWVNDYMTIIKPNSNSWYGFVLKDHITSYY